MFVDDVMKMMEAIQDLLGRDDDSAPTACFSKGKGERGWEKGRGDDPYWNLTPERLKEIENSPNSTPEQKMRAKKIRKMKQKSR